MVAIAVAALKKGNCSAVRSTDMGRDKTSLESVAAAQKPAQMRRVSQLRKQPGRTRLPIQTDTPSDVSVAASQECHRFATDSATDHRLVAAENVRKSQPLKHGGRGSDNQRRGAVAKSDLAPRKFSTNAIL